MVELKFHCAMPMFVARQWIRHRTANVNEYSGRYSLMPLLYYTPRPEDFALQSSQNNQGRSEEAAGAALYEEATARWERMREEASGAYGWLVGQDVAREIARIELPLSTYTQWYWKIDLHNLFHFLRLRADAHAQYEIRAYADRIELRQDGRVVGEHPVAPRPLDRGGEGRGVAALGRRQLLRPEHEGLGGWLGRVGAVERAGGRPCARGRGGVSAGERRLAASAGGEREGGGGQGGERDEAGHGSSSSVVGVSVHDAGRSWAAA